MLKRQDLHLYFLIPAEGVQHHEATGSAAIHGYWEAGVARTICWPKTLPGQRSPQPVPRSPLPYSHIWGYRGRLSEWWVLSSENSHLSPKKPDHNASWPLFLQFNSLTYFLDLDNYHYFELRYLFLSKSINSSKYSNMNGFLPWSLCLWWNWKLPWDDSKGLAHGDAAVI